MIMHQSMDDTITDKHCYSNPAKKFPSKAFFSFRTEAFN